MKKLIAILFSELFLASTCFAQEEPTTVGDDGARVSVLGYHVFHPTKSATEMLIPTSKFREQMEKVKASNIPVITLAQFLAWRRGEAELPPRSILITMDDGWRSVYTEAFPIMKEFQFPFTIYLYKNYIGSSKGGRALSYAMIEEMLQSDLCTIGSHSVSHPFPSKVKKAARAGVEAYDQFLRTELGSSKTFLEEKFKQTVSTYAYPGGYHTEEMFELADELGYDNLFTVKPGKVRRNTDGHILPRYIVLGNHDSAFEAALVFRNGSRVADAPVTLPHPVTPGPGNLVAARLPLIAADLSLVEGLDPRSLSMKVSGFGQVPADFDPSAKSLSWKVTRPLRQEICEVSVLWKLEGADSFEPEMKWAFRIDREAAYQGR
ncbi:polysaccharide deacetylase family protein [Akkermansiaceae bacterium]|nr:polysaccharide deacetylase family protein [Akkermansiaceae bacterium]